jgi:hypothetical protein
MPGALVAFAVAVGLCLHLARPRPYTLPRYRRNAVTALERVRFGRKQP